ncbi:MAG: transporter substrate-binding domain-containing protein [Candidatus Faecivicinus sp.]|nr:transporter substrate-binding domain-containing protein [Candidatus Faecivicinus sp.]
MKKIFALVLILVLTLSASALAEPFRVGMECGYAPFNWAQVEQTEGSVPIDGNQGYADGYDVQIARKIAEGLGRELVIVKIEWDGLIPALNSGMIDAVIAGMSPTEERKLSVLFTDNYYNSDLVIVVRKDGAYANATQLSDFSGARITGQQNTFHYTVIDQIEGVQKMTAMESFPSMIVALNAGVIDGYVSERPGAESACAANADLTYVEFGENGFVTSEDDTAIAIALKLTDTELCGQINEILSTIDSDTRLALMTQALADQPGAAE